MVKFYVNIPRELRTKVKTYCAEKGYTMNEFFVTNVLARMGERGDVRFLECALAKTVIRKLRQRLELWKANDLDRVAILKMSEVLRVFKEVEKEYEEGLCD